MVNFKAWNGWRKRNLNSRFYQLLVLLGIAHSPTFEVYYNLELKMDKIRWSDILKGEEL